MPFNQHVNKSEQEFSTLWGDFYENVGDKLLNRIDTTDPVEYLEAVDVNTDMVSVLQLPSAYDPAALLEKYADRVMSYSAVYLHQPGPSAPMSGILVNIQIEKKIVVQLWIQPRSDIKEEDFYMVGIPSLYATNAGIEINKFIKENKDLELDKKTHEAIQPAGFGGHGLLEGVR